MKEASEYRRKLIAKRYYGLALGVDLLEKGINPYIRVGPRAEELEARDRAEDPEAYDRFQRWCWEVMLYGDYTKATY